MHHSDLVRRAKPRSSEARQSDVSVDDRASCKDPAMELVERWNSSIGSGYKEVERSVVRPREITMAETKNRRLHVDQATAYGQSLSQIEGQAADVAESLRAFDG